MLFDGTSVNGLRGYGQAAFPEDRWRIVDGRLRTVPGSGVDLVTATTYRDFEVEFVWAVTPGGNSGVIYRVAETDQPSWTTGPEYQVLDDVGHRDGASAATSAGALYDLIAPSADKRLMPVGEDNEGRVVVRDGRVEHWLNGAVVVEYEWDSPDTRALVESSKFRDLERFMRIDEGHVVFQHHGEEVSYGRIRIRSL